MAVRPPYPTAKVIGKQAGGLLFRKVHPQEPESKMPVEPDR
jgi:hypothetical protein